MRKIGLILIGMMVVILTGCGNGNVDISNNTSTEVVDIANSTSEESNKWIENNGEESDTEETVIEEKNETFLSNATDFSGIRRPQLYVDVPNWQNINSGYTEMFILNGIEYVSVTADKTTLVTTLEEAQEAAFAELKLNVQNDSHVESLVVESDSVETISTETIDTLEIYRFEGHIIVETDAAGYDGSYNAYAIGYTFIWDEIPCMVLGSVIDKEQPQDLIDEMKQIIEDTISTLKVVEE